MNRWIAELIMLISDVNQQFAGRGDFGVIPREQNSCAGVLLKDRGPLDVLPGYERFSSVHRTINGFGVENHEASSDQRWTCAPRGCGERVDGVESDGDEVCVHDR